jgi:hypothetical protein
MIKLFTTLLLLLAPVTATVSGKLDRESFCVLGANGLPKPGPQIVLVYDLSEPYPAVVIRNILTRLQSEVSDVRPQTRLTLFVFDRASAFHTSVPVDSFCLAGKYSTFDPFAPNVNILARRRQAEIKRLEKFLLDNNPQESTTGSPILSAFVSAVNSQNVLTSATDIKAFLISDLVEYSNVANFYDEKLTVARAKSLAKSVSEGTPDLGQVSNVTFLYVKRERYIKMQNDSLVLFWSELMSLRNAKSTTFISIQ